MISSMTGFGAADGVVGDTRASVEIRTVNHRFFSPNLKLPAAFARWEGEIRELLRQKIARGHVTLVARIDRTPIASGPVIDEARLARDDEPPPDRSKGAVSPQGAARANQAHGLRTDGWRWSRSPAHLPGDSDSGRQARCRRGARSIPRATGGLPRDSAVEDCRS